MSYLRDPAIEAVLSSKVRLQKKQVTSLREQYEKLMPNRVRLVLLVSGLYDCFTFQETGMLNEMVFGKYAELGIPAPDMERVSTSEEAIKRLTPVPGRRTPDLLICLLRIGGTAGVGLYEFLQKIKRMGCNIPIALLATNGRELSMLDPRVDQMCKININKRMGWEAGQNMSASTEVPLWTTPFLWQGNPQLLVSMTKLVEDRLNMKQDIETFPGIGVILLIEDSVKFYSSYLPLLYSELINQTVLLTQDGVNEAHKITIKRARPKVILANFFEEAEDVFKRYHENMFCVIADAGFLKDGEYQNDAGVQFAKMVRSYRPNIPILIQSSDEANREPAESVSCKFVNKSSATLLREIQDFVQIELGFGPFYFVRPGNPSPEAVAYTLKDFIKNLQTVSDESLLYHFRLKHFSTWLAARLEYNAARTFRKNLNMDFSTVQELRDYLVYTLLKQREQNQSRLIADFANVVSFDLNSARFVRMGSGSLGGKGRGIAFMNALMNTYDFQRAFPTVSIFVPRTLAIATDIFDAFMERNDLYKFALEATDDEAVKARFCQGTFSDALLADLRFYLSKTQFPLAVRSSSLFEDTHHQPFAGVYETYFLPNNSPVLEERLSELTTAIKLVYACTFFNEPKAYAKATSFRTEEMRMAVLVQQVVGGQHGTIFYPDFSGVARSHNFYPKPGMRTEDGICVMAMGLGSGVVDGGQTLKFSPPHPDRPYIFSTPERRYATAQTEFQALDLSPAERVLQVKSRCRLLSVDMVDANVMNEIGSVYDPKSNTVTSGCPRRAGRRFVSFAKLLAKQRPQDDQPMDEKPPGLLEPEAQRLLKHPELLPDFSNSKKEDEVTNAPLHDLLDNEQRRYLHNKDILPRSTQDSQKEPSTKAPEAPEADSVKAFPICEIVNLMLGVGSAGMSCPVEIEFSCNFGLYQDACSGVSSDTLAPGKRSATNMHRVRSKSPTRGHLQKVKSDPPVKESEQLYEFAILQIRPQSTLAPFTACELSSQIENVVQSSAALCTSRSALGHGTVSDLRDVVLYNPYKWVKDDLEAVAEEVNAINEQLQNESRPYVLIAPGRWGSQSGNGVPVRWSNVNYVSCLVEMGLPESPALSPSEGTHFFQNITSFNVSYFTLSDDSALDLKWLEEQPQHAGAHKHIRHYRFNEPLHVIVDGYSHAGIIMKPGKDPNVYIYQANAYFALEEMPCYY